MISALCRGMSPLPPSAGFQAPLAPRPYAEFKLPFVIARTTLAHDVARARLEGMEHTLATLIRRWRAGSTLSAARDIRVAPQTLTELLAWVERGGQMEPAFIERLAVYYSGAVADPAVPIGWIRVYLTVGRAGPDGCQAKEG